MRRAILIAAIVVLPVLVGVGCSSTSTSSPPDPSDVQAARACEAFTNLLQNKATGQEVLDAANPLIAGAAADEASSVPGPKWATLGADIITAAGDFNTNDPKLAEDSKTVATECGTIPDAAKRAGGFTK